MLLRYDRVTLEGLHAISTRIAGDLRPGSVVFVTGEVGAGKTEFCRTIVCALCDVPFQGSPTFPVVCEYRCPEYFLYHIDLYRITSLRECHDLGLDELLVNNVALIEWPDILGDTIKCNIRVSLSTNDSETRNLEVEYL